MVEHLAGAMAGQIPIAVMDEIANRRPIRFGFDLHDEAVFFVEAVDHRGIEIAGKALLAIGRTIGEGDGAPVRRGTAGPQMLVETPDAAMQMIAALVAAQLMGFSVEGEPAAADAIAVAPADRPEIAVRDKIGGEVLLAQRDIRELALAIRRVELEQGRAQLHDPRRQAPGHC